jgi:MSHA biogenesis protein MshK
LLCCALLTTPFAGAQGLTDPTRPPAALLPEAAPASDASGPALQSILISPTRKLAIINGQTVRPGDKVGDARVVRITENEVVLRDGRQSQTLKLFPQIQKKMAAERTQSKSAAGQRQRDKQGR